MPGMMLVAVTGGLIFAMIGGAVALWLGASLPLALLAFSLTGATGLLVSAMFLAKRVDRDPRR